MPATTPPRSKPSTSARWRSCARVPGVEHVSAGQSVPFRPSLSALIALPGTDQLPVSGRTYPTYYAVTPDHFATVGGRILRGRAFLDSDRAGAPPVIIVEQALGEKLWPGQDPVGKCLILGRQGDPCREVVGVASNTRRFVRDRRRRDALLRAAGAARRADPAAGAARAHGRRSARPRPGAPRRTRPHRAGPSVSGNAHAARAGGAGKAAVASRQHAVRRVRRRRAVRDDGGRLCAARVSSWRSAPARSASGSRSARPRRARRCWSCGRASAGRSWASPSALSRRRRSASSCSRCCSKPRRATAWFTLSRRRALVGMAAAASALPALRAGRVDPTVALQTE